MRKKKSILIICMLCVIVTFSGCGPIDKIGKWFDEKVEEVQETYEKAKYSKVRAEATDEQWDKAVQQVYNEASVGTKISNFFQHPIQSIKGNAATAYANDKGRKDVSQRADDIVKAEAKKNGESTLDLGDPKLIMIVIILIVVIVLVLLLFAMRGRSAPRPVRVKRPSRIASMPVVEQPVVMATSDANANYDRLLLEKCKSRGLNYNDVLARFDGNSRAAVDAMLTGKL